jgi:cytoskeletal protein CcmA (bactofilin family)
LGGKVILSDKAYVRGDIAANSIIVGGKIDGHLKGKERVELKATGQVFGDIMTSRLSISEGAIFNGTAHMEEAEIKPAKKSENKVVEFFSKEIIKG